MSRVDVVALHLQAHQSFVRDDKVISEEPTACVGGDRPAVLPAYQKLPVIAQDVCEKCWGSGGGSQSYKPIVDNEVRRRGYRVSACLAACAINIERRAFPRVQIKFLFLAWLSDKSLLPFLIIDVYSEGLPLSTIRNGRFVHSECNCPSRVSR